MCVVSAVSGHYQKVWPKPEIWPKYKLIPNVGEPIKIPTAEEIKEFRDLLDKAREIDTKTNQPDCQDDAKREWLERFEKAILDLGDLIRERPA